MMAAGETPMRTVTMDGIAGQRTVTTLGFVLGLAIRSRGLGGNIMAGLDALGNGSALGEYRDDLAAVRREAIAQMEAEARDLGANAIVGVRFDTAAVGHDMSEIVAYGTAVVIEPNP
jgi:uncharacterized protein YbjQ (UPF0145 family)